MICFQPPAFNPQRMLQVIELHGEFVGIELAAQALANVAFSMQQAVHRSLDGVSNTHQFNTMMLSDEPLSVRALGNPAQLRVPECEILASLYWLRLIHVIVRAVIKRLQPFWMQAGSSRTFNPTLKAHLLSMLSREEDLSQTAWQVCCTDETSNRDVFFMACRTFYNRHQPLWSGDANSFHALFYGIVNSSLRQFFVKFQPPVRSYFSSEIEEAVLSFVQERLNMLTDVILQRFPGLLTPGQKIDCDAFFIQQYSVACLHKRPFLLQPLLHEYMSGVFIRDLILKKRGLAKPISATHYQVRALCAASREFREVMQIVNRHIVVTIFKLFPEASETVIWELGGALAGFLNQIAAD